MGAKDRAAMTPVQELTDEQFQEHALSILERELGLDGLVRSCASTTPVQVTTPQSGTSGLAESRSPTSPAN